MLRSCCTKWRHFVSTRRLQHRAALKFLEQSDSGFCRAVLAVWSTAAQRRRRNRHVVQAAARRLEGRLAVKALNTWLEFLVGDAHDW